jgi:hypothetical protein
MDHQGDALQMRTVPLSARLLGWLGVVPFAVLSLVCIFASAQAASQAGFALVLYGMIILSFMGGAQWGLAMVARVQASAAMPRRLAISILPPLAALAMAALPPRGALLGLAILFTALLVYDHSTVRAGVAPAWYRELRTQLTTAVVICLLAAAGLGWL